MALPPQHLQQHYEQPHHHQQQSIPLRNFLTMDGQISPHMQYYEPSNLQDQSENELYAPTLHLAGFSPGTVPVADGNDMGVDLQWNDGCEPKEKMLEEFDFLGNYPPMSCIDLFPQRPVSTGLNLSLNNTGAAASSYDSALLSLLGDDIDCELRQQDAEIDRFLKIQGERLQQAILHKVQASNCQMLSSVEQKVLQELREKEAELVSISKRNMDLEERIEQLTAEAVAWQQCALVSENMINTLKFNLQQASAQRRDLKEGCGDSEVDDIASCCNGRGVDLQLLSKENNNMRELMTCKACRINRVCMLLLPCRHLCLCDECESKLSHCPMCISPKITGMKVYM